VPTTGRVNVGTTELDRIPAEIEWPDVAVVSMIGRRSLLAAQGGGTAMTDLGADAAGAAPRVAFQGDHGAFSEEAALALLAAPRAVSATAMPTPLTMPLRDFAAVGDAVRNGAADYGVLPIENSIYGGVTAAYDVLGAGGLVVVAEHVRRIDLCLLGVHGAAPHALRRVISHPVALAQCRRYLAGLPDARVEAWYDTAGAARAVATASDPTLAAVAGWHAGEVNGLEVLAAGIQDRPDNATRFLLVRRADDDDGARAAGADAVVAADVAPADATHGSDGGATEHVPDRAAGRSYRAMLVLETDHRPGALVRVLQPFAELGVNLTRIESRPADVPWSYRFYIELATDGGAGAVHAAVDAVRPHAHRLGLLGCFPA
jgi:prephenate dehydratase